MIGPSERPGPESRPGEADLLVKLLGIDRFSVSSNYADCVDHLAAPAAAWVPLLIIMPGESWSSSARLYRRSARTWGRGPKVLPDPPCSAGDVPAADAAPPHGARC